jgi:hypothetical protein
MLIIKYKYFEYFFLIFVYLFLNQVNLSRFDLIFVNLLVSQVSENAGSGPALCSLNVSNCTSHFSKCKRYFDLCQMQNCSTSHFRARNPHIFSLSSSQQDGVHLCLDRWVWICLSPSTAL